MKWEYNLNKKMEFQAYKYINAIYWYEEKLKLNKH